MRKLRILCLLPVLALQGCFFFYVPGSFIDAAADGITGAKGDHCIASTAKVGDTIQLTNGSTWKVQSISGTSRRCQHPAYPIRAELTPI